MDMAPEGATTLKVQAVGDQWKSYSYTKEYEGSIEEKHKHFLALDRAVDKFEKETGVKCSIDIRGHSEAKPEGGGDDPDIVFIDSESLIGLRTAARFTPDGRPSPIPLAYLHAYSITQLLKEYLGMNNTSPHTNPNSFRELNITSIEKPRKGSINDLTLGQLEKNIYSFLMQNYTQQQGAEQKK